MPSEKRPIGRPTTYTDELAAMICFQLMMPRTLKSICQDKEMPAQSSVYKWLIERPEFSELYARARQVQAHMFADEIIEIADDSSGDVICDEFGNAKQNHEFVQRSKLRMDARKWHASKTAPKIYGDKPEVELDKDSSITDLIDVLKRSQDNQ